MNETMALPTGVVASLSRVEPVPAPTATVTVTDWITAVSSGIYTLLTALLVVAAFYAWRTARAALAESQTASIAATKAAEAAIASNQQAQSDSLARSRPYIFLEVVPGLLGPGTFDLKISNRGQSAAFDLTLNTTSYPLKSDEIVDSLRELFTTPRTVPPSSTLRVAWTLHRGCDEAGMPSESLVKARYHGTTAIAAHIITYEEEYFLRTAGAGLWPIPDSGPSLADGRDPTTR